MDRLQFKVRPDAIQAMVAQINGAIGKVIKFPGDNRFKIDKPRFAELAPNSKRYGLLFGATVDFSFVKLRIKRIVLSLDGLQIDGAIGVRVPLPIKLGSVALSGVDLTYYTGQNDGPEGLVVDADVSPGTADVAKLAKIDAQLDLREVAKLKFGINGDVVVFNSLPILLARGEIDLAEARAHFKTETPPMLSDVIQARGEGWIDGSDEKDPSFGAHTALAILGVELEGEMSASISDPGQLFLKTSLDTPIGSGGVQFESHLNLGQPKFGADIELDLFGWNPAEARIRANPGSARADFKFLLIQLGVTVRRADQFDPAVILAMLKSLFDISLEDLLKLDPTKITITVGKMGSDGSIQEMTAGSHDGSDGDGSDQSSASRGDRGDNAEQTPPQQADQSSDMPPTPQEERFVEDMNDGFGKLDRGRVYCHRIWQDRYVLLVDHQFPDPGTFDKHAWWQHPPSQRRDIL